MKPPALFTLALALAPPLTLAFTAQIGIQPIHPSHPPPVLLAELVYTLDPTTSTFTSPTSDSSDPTAEITSFELPTTLPEGFDPATGLVRIGAFDARAGVFLPGGEGGGSVTVARAASLFEKGYAPALQVLADPVSGDVLSVAVRGVRIDAGYTRDFGPRVEVRAPARGGQPELNRPVVLSPDGKTVGEPKEQTMLQKYWWLIGIVMIVAMAGGGDGK